MKMLNEIKRIKDLMMLSEATNPITNFFVGPYISKSWTAMKKGLGDSVIRISQYLDTNLDNVTRTTLDDLASQVGISYPESLDSMYLVDNLVSKVDNMTTDQLNVLTKSLSKIKIFSDNLVESLISDENFIKTLRSSIDSGVSPNEVKTVLTKYLGEENANTVFNKARVSVPTSSLVKQSSDVAEFILTPQAMDALVSTVESKSLKKVVNKVLSDKQSMDKIMKMAEELSKTTQIGPDFFKTEFQKIVQSYPSFWDNAKQTEFAKFMKKAFELAYVKKETGKVRWWRITGTVILGLVVAATWTSSGLKNAYRDDCLKEKGIDTPEEFNTLKANKSEYEKVMGDCSQYVLSKVGKFKLKGLGSIVNPFVDLLFGDDEDYVPSFVTPNASTTTTTTSPTPNDDEGALN